MARVYQSTIVKAPIGRVWPVLRDFNGLPKWHGAITESRIEQDLAADQVGCIRAFSLADGGGRIREQLVALSDYDMCLSYTILESPMPLENYAASLSLKPITEGNVTFLDWSAEFECLPEQEAELVQHIGDAVFKQGFIDLKHYLGVF